MAHFAELDSNNFVLRVITVANEELLDANGQESEEQGVQFCRSLFGADTNWKQTSYNKKFRKNYAGVGMYYDPQRDMFLRPQPFPSWSLNETEGRWEPPVPQPIDAVLPITAIAFPGEGRVYEWDEPTTSWKDVTSQVTQGA